MLYYGGQDQLSIQTGSDAKTYDATVTVTHNQKCVIFYNSCYEVSSGEAASKPVLNVLS